jgi:hypothetical protein
MAQMVARMGIFFWSILLEARPTYSTVEEKGEVSKRGVSETSLVYNAKNLDLNSKSNIWLDLEILSSLIDGG